MRRSLLLGCCVSILLVCGLSVDRANAGADGTNALSVFFNFESVYPQTGPVEVSKPEGSEVPVALLFDGSIPYNSLYDRDHVLIFDGRRIKTKVEEYPLGLNSVGYFVPANLITEGTHYLDILVKESSDKIHKIEIAIVVGE